MTATISITDKGKTITYHAHHMRDVIEPVNELDSTERGDKGFGSSGIK